MAHTDILLVENNYFSHPNDIKYALFVGLFIQQYLVNTVTCTSILTTEGSILSSSKLGPSKWAVGEPSLESVLLSDEFILVSLTFEFTTFAVIT